MKRALRLTPLSYTLSSSCIIAHLSGHEGDGFRVGERAGDAAAELPHETEGTQRNTYKQILVSFSLITQ